MNITQTNAIITITSTTNSNYKYVHVIQRVAINETTIISDVITTSSSSYTLGYDGYFIITEFRLPTNDGSDYWTDGTFIYDPSGVISVEELMALDPEVANLTRTDEDHVSLYFLNNYYINLLKSKYLKNICNCGCGCIDKQDKIKLDTLTMGLDLIEALLTKAQYYEVQRIIEKLMVCFGMVDNNCNCR